MCSNSNCEIGALQINKERWWCWDSGYPDGQKNNKIVHPPHVIQKKCKFHVKYKRIMKILWSYMIKGLFIWDKKPWLMWLSALSAGLQTKGLLVHFPARAHAWVAGHVPSRGRGTWEASTHWCFSPSLSPSLPLWGRINKLNK